MKKIFLFLILLLPLANALAVVPSHLEIEDHGELKIINTRDEEVKFRITGAYEEEFVLGAKESRIINVEEEGIVTIEEVYNKKLVNAVSVEIEKEKNNTFGISVGSALLSLLVGGVYSWKKIRKRKA